MFSHTFFPPNTRSKKSVERFRAGIADTCLQFVTR